MPGDVVYSVSGSIACFISSIVLLPTFVLRKTDGGVQKLSGAVFCTAGTAEKMTILDQTNGESVLYNAEECKN